MIYPPGSRRARSLSAIKSFRNLSSFSSRHFPTALIRSQSPMIPLNGPSLFPPPKTVPMRPSFAPTPSAAFGNKRFPANICAGISSRHILGISTQLLLSPLIDSPSHATRRPLGRARELGPYAWGAVAVILAWQNLNKLRRAWGCLGFGCL